MCKWSLFMLVILSAIGCGRNSQAPGSGSAEPASNASVDQERLNTLAVYPTSNVADMRICSVASFSELENEIRKINWNEPAGVAEVIFSHDPVTTNKESISATGSFAATSDDEQFEIEITTIAADGVYRRFYSKSPKSVDEIVSVFKAYYEKSEDWREQQQWTED